MIIFFFVVVQEQNLVLDLERLNLLVTHSSDNSNINLLALIEGVTDLISQITLRNLQIILGLSIVQQARAISLIVDINQTEIRTLNLGDLDVMGRGAQILELLTGEDVDGDEVNLSMTVLSSLGGRHLNNLARVTLDDNVSTLAEGGGLSGGGGISVGFGHFEREYERDERTRQSREKKKKEEEGKEDGHVSKVTSHTSKTRRFGEGG